MQSKQRFCESIQSQFGFTPEQAETIYTVYKREGIIKICSHTGQVQLAHGAFWDEYPMRNALK